MRTCDNLMLAMKVTKELKDVVNEEIKQSGQHFTFSQKVEDSPPPKAKVQLEPSVVPEVVPAYEQSPVANEEDQTVENYKIKIIPSTTLISSAIVSKDKAGEEEKQAAWEQNEVHKSEKKTKKPVRRAVSYNLSALVKDVYQPGQAEGNQ